MDQNMPLVSIIVPVYNRQDTLDACLASICGQRYENLEIIVIDDGSSDQSPRIIADWADRDPRIRPVIKNNTGVSRTRNMGIDMAQGSYLQFVDSDDRIPANATQALVQCALEQDSDMVVADYYMITGLKYKRNGSIGKEGAYTCRQYARFMLYSPADYYYGVLWNKLYRTDIVREHHLYCLPDISMYEDFFFNLEYLRYAKTVSVAKEAVYYYVRRKNSLSSLCSMNLAKVLETRLFIFRHFKKVYAELGLYNDNRFEISLYPITFARDSGYAISPEVAEAEGIGSFPLSASRRAIRRLSM